MARFFIDRPIFAWVIAIVIMVAGVLAITSLPVSQYPNIAPPAISIAATYPGASAQTLQDTVTQVIEQKMNGIDNLRYVESASDSSGSVSITLTFDAGTNPDIAQVQVQNKLQLAIPLLPQEVQQLGAGAVQLGRQVGDGADLGGPPTDLAPVGAPGGLAPREVPPPADPPDLHPRPHATRSSNPPSCVRPIAGFLPHQDSVTLAMLQQTLFVCMISLRFRNHHRNAHVFLSARLGPTPPRPRADARRFRRASLDL
jgi:hypothetical protein